MTLDPPEEQWPALALLSYRIDLLMVEFYGVLSEVFFKMRWDWMGRGFDRLADDRLRSASETCKYVREFWREDM